MRAVIQRVSNASVAVDGQCVGSIDIGFLILIGVTHEDTEQDANWLASKVTQLRIFSDDEGKMNLDLSQVGGRILVISQFTLFAETKKGNRPSFIKAAGADKANALYTYFSDLLEQLLNQPVERGVFGADMKVSLVNDGPVTLIIDTKNKE
ncbi:MAG: D-aminoacyl-tRNA deacylase [Bacteroidetes bacterium]|nr:D-aminoacyl-tRNA deacylase [Bacteroidota bacterium]MDA0950037.1 D-aminoacyl-tRNA deacylase [Bacteroidota bacterium]